MGTNYYLIEKTCPHCGRGDERLHIGKSSAGWCFSLHVDPDMGINSLADWEARWSKPDASIVDEYGEGVSPADMLRTITQRSWKGHATDDPHWLAQNEAVPGPNGLARHRIGRHCIGHGESTYDLMPGEFS